jgi:hypothetical protein
VYDEAFTLDFLKTMMADGIFVFYLQGPDSRGNPTLDWNGRAVNMVIEPGTSTDMHNMEPKLEWTILPGGTRFEVYSTSVALLAIHSVSPSEDPDLGQSNPETVYFKVETDQGAVHIFEASSPEERDKIVNGLRNVLARSAYHLIVGDSSTALGLYNSDQPTSATEALAADSGAPWSCPGPDETLNQMAHVMLG